MSKRVLIIGSGGREHALAWKLKASPQVAEVFVAPGNDGMRPLVEILPARDEAAWIAAAHEHRIDLVVVGPEDPLVEGLADALRAEGFAVFGPSANAARLEGDKDFAKAFMNDAGIPTASSESFGDLDAALQWLRKHPGPRVVKATGLAAGKGVSVCESSEEVEAALRAMLQERVFGEAGAKVLLEERLVGPEISVFVVLDGERAAWFAASRDHKRLLDGDRGPNTGGMGAFTPVKDADDALMQTVLREVLEPSLAELRRRELDYRGLLYIGLMLTSEGPKVLEYNCRFGDPETQVVLPSYPGDLFELLDGAARGKLPVQGPLPLEGSALGVVLAASGYPLDPRRGDAIQGLETVPDDVLVFHAGVRSKGSSLVTSGGRVLCVVAQDSELARAREKAMQVARHIHFDGMQSRNDIAEKELSL